MLSRGDIYGAIVVNAGRKHVETAGRLIENHVPVLVEKPVALMLSEAERLIAVAAASETMVMPSLAMRYCQYLRNFRDAAVEEGIGPCTSVDMRWIDPSGEVRYGAAKVADPSLGIAEDVATHISTLLSVVCGEASFRIDKAEITRGGLAVSLAGAWGESHLTAPSNGKPPAGNAWWCFATRRGEKPAWISRPSPGASRSAQAVAAPIRPGPSGPPR